MKQRFTHRFGRHRLTIAACCLAVAGGAVALPVSPVKAHPLERPYLPELIPEKSEIITAGFISPEMVAQVVKGKVTGDSGEGIPGVTVVVKGTSIGTITDLDGNYSLSIPDGNENPVLVFSFVGFVTQEVPVNNQSVVNVTLAEDIQALEEVVVVGYGVQKKETVTGSVATVKGEELSKSPAVNLSNSIAGRMPGVVATNAGGEPGQDNSTIRIRGANSLGNNDALVVIDGIPDRAGGFSRLNPNDIASMSVLKDAAAAIYGSRAANGVILITTKRGISGKPKFTYSFNQGFAQPTVTPEMSNAAQFAEMNNDLAVYGLPVAEWNNANAAFKSEGTYTRPDGKVVNAPFTPEDMQLFKDGTDPWLHPNTDWYEATLKEWSPQSRHNVQITGGSEDFKYLASLGYQNQDAYYKNSATGYKQYDVRINLDANVNKYIKASLGLVGRNENRFYPTRGAGSIFRMMMRGLPTEPAYWPNGLPGPDIENGENPVVITTNATGYDQDNEYFFQSNGSLDITNPWIEGLTLTGTAAIDKRLQNRKRWETPWYLYSRGSEFEADGTPVLNKSKKGPAEPRLTQWNEDQLNVLLGARLAYEKTVGDHALNFMAGMSRETVEYSDFNAFRRYYISPSIDQLFAGGDPEKDNTGGAWERARLNYFGRVAYNFKEKYLAEFLWRYDGSYNFAPDSRYGFFPGILLGYRISEESFWKDNLSFINSFKIRGSWGQLGNDQIWYDHDGRDGQSLQEYQYLSTMGFNTYVLNGAVVKTLYETRVLNPNVSWEVANNSNVGIEGQLFDGRIYFEADAFYNKRTSILWQKNASVPQTTGMNLPAENIGEVENKGWEFLLGYNGMAGDLQYNVSVNGGYNKNTILYWDEAPGAPEWQKSTGKPMNTYLIYEYDGVFRDQAAIDANNLDYSAVVGTLRPGDMKYKDIDGDGKITPDDQTRTDASNLPNFQGGLNMSMQYKNFDLSVLFQGSAGAQVYVSAGESGRIGNYLLDIYENRWTVDNPSSEHPRIADRSDQYFSNGNSYWLRSTDYIRLKNFEIGFTLPASVGEKAGISNLRIYFNGLNLITWDKYNVFDPESTSSTGQYYPQSRILNTGVTLTF